MPTTVANLVVSAFRESNIIALGAYPTPAQNAEARYYLGNLLRSVFGNSIGFMLADWSVRSPTEIYDPAGVPIVPDGFVVLPQSRLVCDLAAAAAILLDPFPQDGQRLAVIDATNKFATNPLTLSANGRKIDGVTTLTLNTNGFVGSWLYRADLAQWLILPEPLDDTTPWPLPPEFDDYFMIALAGRLDPRYGRTLDPESKERLAQQTQQLAVRYGQSQVRNATDMDSPQAGLKGI